MDEPAMNTESFEVKLWVRRTVGARVRVIVMGLGRLKKDYGVFQKKRWWRWLRYQARAKLAWWLVEVEGTARHECDEGVLGTREDNSPSSV